MDHVLATAPSITGFDPVSSGTNEGPAIHADGSMTSSRVPSIERGQLLFLSRDQDTHLGPSRRTHLFSKTLSGLARLFGG